MSEITKKRQHTKGAVGVAHIGHSDAGRQPDLRDARAIGRISNGKYTVFGHIVDGDDVLDTLQVGDVIRKGVRQRLEAGAGDCDWRLAADDWRLATGTSVVAELARPLK